MNAPKIKPNGRKLPGNQSREARLQRLNAAVTAMPIWSESHVPRVMYTSSFRNVLVLMFPDRVQDIHVITSLNGPLFSIMVPDSGTNYQLK